MSNLDKQEITFIKNTFKENKLVQLNLFQRKIGSELYNKCVDLKLFEKENEFIKFNAFFWDKINLLYDISEKKDNELFIELISTIKTLDKRLKNLEIHLNDCSEHSKKIKKDENKTEIKMINDKDLELILNQDKGYSHLKNSKLNIEVKKRLKIILPMIDKYENKELSRNEVNLHAELNNISSMTIFIWLQKYHKSGRNWKSLIPNYNRRGNRSRRLDKTVEEIIEKHITHKCECCNFYSKKKEKWKNIIFECEYFDLNTPSYKLVLKRINSKDN